MTQKTNLNINPYFDDLDPDSNYFKVLFKPGYPVQARELTTLQSILQNQIERFGNHILKEGSKVSGGEITYYKNLPCVLIQPTYNGVDVELYALSLVDSELVGSSTGIRAKVISVLPSSISERGITTLYIQYLESDSSSSLFTGFADDEVLINGGEDIVRAVTIESVLDDDIDNEEEIDIFLPSGEGVFRTISRNSAEIGSAISIEDGIYYIRGFFVRIYESLILLEQYNNLPNYRVGLKIYENIAYPQDDPTLYDNAAGFSNFAAPGADRFILSAELKKVPQGNYEEENFIQLADIRDGELLEIEGKSRYADIAEELARRTRDQSGDFYATPPSLQIKESLNNLKGNDGVYGEDEVTDFGNTPSKDIGIYQISPFKAYVQGYEVEQISPSYIDFFKPRTTELIENQDINYVVGPTFTIHRVNGAPKIGINTSYYVELRDSRVGTSKTIRSGKEIGIARVYDYALEYGLNIPQYLDLYEWDAVLYDIQTYSEITLNEPITLQTPTHIRGLSSGSVGFLRYPTNNSGIITAYCTNGNFTTGEKLIFNGIVDKNNRSVKTHKHYSTEDVKSLYSENSPGNYFSADIKQVPTFDFGQVTISGSSSGVSTITSRNISFDNFLKEGSIVGYTNPDVDALTFSKVISVSNSTAVITGVATVSGICEGSLPSSSITPSDLKLFSTRLQRSTDNSFYTRLPKRKISSVNLTDNSEITIRQSYDVNISQNQTNTIVSDEKEFFLPYDEERYILVTESGQIEPLSSDKIIIGSGGKELTVIGLSTSATTGTLITTLKKVGVTNKIKIRNKANTLIVDKSRIQGSGIGSTTLNDGLVYGNYPYGTRVQDEEICLLSPDVTKILAIYESDDAGNPDLPKVTLTDIDTPSLTTREFVIGEEIIGLNSNSIAIIAEKITDVTIGIVYLNGIRFLDNEVILTRDSNFSSIVSSIVDGDDDITSDYILKDGQTETIYDYSYIQRKEKSTPPRNKIKIVFEQSTISENDIGEFITVNSYSNFDYCDIPSINGISNSDIIDIRPRVATYNVSESQNRSPFEFLGRNFTGIENSKTNILASDESIVVDYSFYLPRIDRIFLDKTGQFQLVEGQPSENPKIPIGRDDSLEIATISLPAYVCDLNEIVVSYAEHKRYQMKDIRKLEERIKNLEYYSTLSLLESKTENLFIPDANGLNRFKSGFFVDNFSSATTQLRVTDVKNSLDLSKSELRPAPYTTQLDLILGTRSELRNFPSNLDFASDIVGEGIKKTGELITLDYINVVEIVQPYATKVQKVTPYRDVYYAGTIELYPTADTWIDNVKAGESKAIEVQGKYTRTRQQQLSQAQLSQQAGFGPVTWNSWEENWTGETITNKFKTSKLGGTTSTGFTVYDQEIGQVLKTGTKTKSGSSSREVEAFQKSSVGEKTLSYDLVKYMRSRNIAFTAKRLKPYTRVYSFFDRKNVNQFIVPKLIEIAMLSGTFLAGEKVSTLPGLVFKQPISGLILPLKAKISFNLCNINHKYGPYTNPTDIFDANPYDRSVSYPTNYSPTSTILNVDIFSLGAKQLGEFSGYITRGMILRGETSGATARVSDIRLITDDVGTVMGSLFIPNPNIPTNPSFETGTKIFRLTDYSNNIPVEGLATTGAEERFYAEGTTRKYQENVLSVRNVRLETVTVIEQQPITDYGPIVVLKTTQIGKIKPPIPGPPGPPGPPGIPGQPAPIAPPRRPPISPPPTTVRPPTTVPRAVPITPPTPRPIPRTIPITPPRPIPITPPAVPRAVPVKRPQPPQDIVTPIGRPTVRAPIGKAPIGKPKPPQPPRKEPPRKEPPRKEPPRKEPQRFTPRPAPRPVPRRDPPRNVNPPRRDPPRAVVAPNPPRSNPRRDPPRRNPPPPPPPRRNPPPPPPRSVKRRR